MAFESFRRKAGATAASVLAFLLVAVPLGIAGVWGSFSDEKIPQWLATRGYPNVIQILLIWTGFAVLISILVYVALAVRPSGEHSDPAVDFLLTPVENNKRDPRLLLTIWNRGSFPLTDIRMRATRYRLRPQEVIPIKVERLPGDMIRISGGKFELTIDNVQKLGKDSVVIKKIRAGRKSKRFELTAIPELRFTKPAAEGEPGGPGGGPGLPKPAVFDYYALRFTFIDMNSRKRYAHYRIIPCDPPYVAYIEHPSMGLALPGEMVNDFMFFAPLEIVKKHQRALYGGAPEEEYPKGI